MTKIAAFLFILFTTTAFQHVAKCNDESSLVKFASIGGNAIKFGIVALDNVKQIYDMMQPKTTKESESDKKLDPGMEQRMTDQIKKVSKQISSLKVNIENMKTEIIDKILSQLPEEVGLRSNLFEIYLKINQIENLFQHFEDYVLKTRDFSIGTLEDFAIHATSHDLNGLPNVLKTIHWMLVQTDVNSGESILSILSKNTQSPAKMCKRQQSLQQMLYMLYDSITKADIKGHTMIQYAFMLLETIKLESKSTEKAQALHQFGTRISNTVQSVKKAMKSASRVVWKCDSNGFEEGVTYTRFNNMVQRYMANEADINLDGTCTATCDDYKRTKVYDCYDGTICSTQRICEGEIWDCEHKTSGEMWICPSDIISSRRYEYIEYGNSQRYGPKGTCKRPSMGIESWTRGMVQCTYCTCTCDNADYAESDRYVNLREVNSNYYDQYVVTGVRLRLIDHMLHLQIQQGRLLPGGLIDESTVYWKKINAYKVNEPLPPTVTASYETIPKEYHDYAILKYKDGRNRDMFDEEIIRRAAFNLDDLDFDDVKENDNHVVVGVRFNLCIVKGSGEHITLETLVSPFNFTSGKIDFYKRRLYSKCRNPDGSHLPIFKSDKTEVSVQGLDIPTEGAGAVPTSQTDQYLYLEPSSMDTDAGQNTLPFLDIQDVETFPHVPLSGVGLFHKSSPGTGGFLSLKLFTFNYEPHLAEETD